MKLAAALTAAALALGLSACANQNRSAPASGGASGE